MNGDRAALISAILAHPEEDTPRLACADWFQEQGDEASVARAEFIRTQIERANLSPTDPRQSELQSRELRLLRKYAAVWCGSHFVFKKCRFRRGFIEYVHLHLRHFLHHRRQMFALEPVRDISLTGWMRATDNLVNRVAACEELKYIETLRIHHQGPHKDPQSNLVALLESPHLTGLQSLRVPRIAITPDARRRFERAPVIRQLRELTLPGLDSYPHRPGEWLADGVPSKPWENLRVFRLRSYSSNMDVLARIASMPFWHQLTELDVNLGWSQSAQVNSLRDLLPDTLRVVHLRGSSSTVDVSALVSLFSRLAHLPLHGLHIHGIPLRSEMLAPLFGESSQCELKELTVSDCGLDADCARVIAHSPSVRDVWSLDLSKNWELPSESAEAIFESEYLRGVTSLDLDGTMIGTRGALSLASAEWTALRSLSLFRTDISEQQLLTLFTSATFRNLVSLSLVGDHSQDVLTLAMAEKLLSLPNLARLELCDDGDLEDEAMQLLRSSESLAWLAEDPVHRENWGDFNPNILPPLDEGLAHVDLWI